jgi:hypothetical protein
VRGLYNTKMREIKCQERIKKKETMKEREVNKIKPKGT